MANIRPNALPDEANPSASDVVIIDGLTTRKTTLEKVVGAGRPLASQAEAEAGVNSTKSMTPLTTRQAIVAYGPNFAPASKGVPIGGTTNQILAKNSNTDNDLKWTNAGAGDVLSVNNANDFASKPDVRKNLSVPVQVADRTALKALDTTKDTLASVQSSGREILFDWRTGDYSAHIAADTLEGMFVKANAIAATVGAWVLRNDGDVNVLHFDAKGDCTAFGVGTDDKTAIQVAWNVARLLKRNLYFPARKYRLTGILSMPTAASETFLPSLIGASDGSTALMWDAGVSNGVQMFNSTPFAYYFEIKNLAFLSIGLTGTGFNLIRAAWFKVENCRFEGWSNGFLGSDILSCTFANNYFRGNNTGFEVAKATASDPNAITFIGNNFGGNLLYGCVITGATSVKFVGGAFEGNGIAGSSPSRCGLRLLECGGAGTMGVDIDTVYFEYNSIVADIYITNTTKPCTYNIHGCVFARYWDGGGTVQYGTNCIQLVGGSTHAQQLNYYANGFGSVASYVPNAGRPYVAVTGSACRVWEDGNLYEDAIERPTFTVTYSGPAGKTSAWARVASTGSLTGSYNFNGAFNKTSTGIYVGTFNFPMDNNTYFAIAHPFNNTANAIVTATTTTTVTVATYNTSWVLTDGPFVVEVKGGKTG